MKLYCFVLHYVSGVRAGIQGHHAGWKLALKYLNKETENSKIVEEWAKKHETIIMLNGGDSDRMNTVRTHVVASGLPWAEFFEDGMEGCRTAICVVVPEENVSDREAEKMLREVIIEPAHPMD